MTSRTRVQLVIKLVLVVVALIGYAVVDLLPHAYGPSAVPDGVSVPPALIWVVAAVAAWLMAPRVAMTALTVLTAASLAELLTTKPLGLLVADADKIAELASFIAEPFIWVAGVIAVAQLIARLMATREQLPATLG